MKSNRRNLSNDQCIQHCPEYRRDLFREAELTGAPVVRHLWLHYPTDPLVFDYELEFFIGARHLGGSTS